MRAPNVRVYLSNGIDLSVAEAYCFRVMQRARFFRWALVLWLFTGWAHAQTQLADLAGEWILNNIYLPNSVPSDPTDERLQVPLQGTGPGAEYVYNNRIGFELIAVQVNTDGTFTSTVVDSEDAFDIGEEISGTVVVREGGLFEVSIPDEPEDAFVFAVNAGHSVMVSLSGFSEEGGNYTEYDFDLMARVPATHTGELLAGDWIYHDAFLSDVFNDHSIEGPLEVRLNSDGTGTAFDIPDDEGPVDVNFTYTLGDNGAVLVDFGEDGPDRFFINSTHDVMVEFNRLQNSGFDSEFVPSQWGTITQSWEYLYTILVKEPTETLTLADLDGVWNLFSYETDRQYFAEDPFVEPGGAPNPDFEPFARFTGADYTRIRIVVDGEDGTFEGTVKRPAAYEPDALGAVFRGSVAIVDNRPRFTFYEDGEQVSLQFYVNASKDFMVVYDYEEGGSTNANLYCDAMVALKKAEADETIWEDTKGAVEEVWVNLDWFGNVFLTSEGSGWVFHQEHGWVYLVGRSFDGFWLWFPGVDIDGGTTGTALWTNKALYPYFLRINPGSTTPAAGYSAVYYARPYYQDNGELWFYDFATGLPGGWFQETPVVPVGP